PKLPPRHDHASVAGRRWTYRWSRRLDQRKWRLVVDRGSGPGIRYSLYLASDLSNQRKVARPRAGSDVEESRRPLEKVRTATHGTQSSERRSFRALCLPFRVSIVALIGGMECSVVDLGQRVRPADLHVVDKQGRTLRATRLLQIVRDVQPVSPFHAQFPTQLVSEALRPPSHQAGRTPRLISSRRPRAGTVPAGRS